MPRLAAVVTDSAGAEILPALGEVHYVIAYPDTVDGAHILVPVKMRAMHRAAVAVSLLEALREFGWTVVVLGGDVEAIQLARLNKVTVLP